MKFVDSTGTLAGTKIREDGCLVCDARIARTGIQLYSGREVDPENEHGMRDSRVVRVYRSGDEVFSADTMKSAAHRHVTNDHPPSGMVDSENWKKVAVGNTADEVSAEGIYIRVPLMVSDAAAIRDIQDGKRELSSGYTSELDWTSGKTPSGDSYDAAQKNIRFNHVAIVQHGRAGSQVRIGDAANWGSVSLNDEEGESTMADKPLKTVTVDGLSIEVTDQGAQVIEKLQAHIRTLNDASATVLKDHATALATKDAALAAKDAELEKLRKQVVDGPTLDKLVAARAELVGKARMVAKDAKFEGLDADGIRRAAVTAVLGDTVVKDKPQAYIDARFDIAVEEAVKSGGKVDAFADASKNGIVGSTDSAGASKKAYDTMLAEMTGEYKKSPGAEPAKAA